VGDVDDFFDCEVGVYGVVGFIDVVGFVGF